MQKGQTITEETRIKMREANLGEKNPMYGKSNKWGKHTEESKQKMSESLMGREVWNKDLHGDPRMKGTLGYKHTDEAKKEMSEQRKGRKLSEEHKKKIGLKSKGNKHRLGQKASEETKKKMSASQMGKHNGEKCNWWIDGRTPENKLIRRGVEFRLWRESVFARDNWTCQKTGERGRKLHPHHIKNFALYPELRFAIDNGVTLSEKAHKDFHKIYGYKNNQEQLNEFLA